MGNIIIIYLILLINSAFFKFTQSIHYYKSQESTQIPAMHKQPQNNAQQNLATFIKDNDMIQILHRKNIKYFFPIQYQTFDIIYDGYDIVARDRTGSGKTLAFSLPVITRMREQQRFNGKMISPKFLIVLPTRQLAIQVKDQIESLRLSGRDFKVGAVYGGDGMNKQINMIEKGLDIIVGTPGRLLDFLSRRIIRCQSIEVVCLDEADQMLNMGFKDDIQQIYRHIRAQNKNYIQNLLFSATIPDWIWDISERYLSQNYQYIDLVRDSSIQTSKTVKHYKISARNYERDELINGIIDKFLNSQNVKVLIFCETKREVDRLKSENVINLRSKSLHGDVQQATRQRIYKQFKSGNLQCIIATDVAARGLDFPSIDLIIQMSPPKTSQKYLHRSGRTGRAGSQGICVTFYESAEKYFLERIENSLKIEMINLNASELKIIPKSKRFSDRNSIDDDMRAPNRKFQPRNYQSRNNQPRNFQPPRNYEPQTKFQSKNFYNQNPPPPPQPIKYQQKPSEPSSFPNNTGFTKKSNKISPPIQETSSQQFIQTRQFDDSVPTNNMILQELEEEPNSNDLSVIQPKQSSQTVVKQYQINKSLVKQPKGLKSLPAVSLYIRKTKVSVSMSRVTDHSCSILFFPYSDYKMDLYPGNLINQCMFDYKKKLKEREKPVNQIYFQKCIGISNFQIFAFTKVDKDKPDSKTVVRNLIQAGNKIKSEYNSIMVPYCSQLGNPSDLLDGLIGSLQKTQKYNQIIISMKNQKQFLELSGAFVQIIKKLVQNNEIVIE